MRSLALLALLAALVAGCGANEAATDPFAEAAAKTDAAKSMRIEMTVTTPVVPGAEPVEIEATGVADGDRASMSMTMPPVQGVDLGEIEVRMLGTVMYMRMAFLEEAGPDVKPWVEIDLRTAGKEAGVDIGALLELSKQSDPTQALDFLRAAGEVEEVGQAEVRGVPTTHYRGTIDFEKYADELEQKDGVGPAAARALREVVRQTGQKTVPMELWVDGDSLVRRMKWEQAVPGTGGQPTTTATSTMELFDFGADVEVERPPADETMSFEELQELGGS
jgi:hypothetical protein